MPVNGYWLQALRRVHAGAGDYGALALPYSIILSFTGAGWRAFPMPLTAGTGGHVFFFGPTGVEASL